MEKVFDKNSLEKYLNVINQSYINFLSYYNLYRAFQISTQYWEHQTENNANLNIDILDKYASIFGTFNWFLDLSISQLYKIFDRSERNAIPAISIYLLIDYIREFRIEINTVFWKEIITKEFLIDCDKMVATVYNKLIELKRSRDNRLHNLQIPKSEKLKFTDIEDISKIVDKLFNLIDSTIRLNSWSFDFLHDEPKRDFVLLIKDLKNFKAIQFAIMNNSRIKSDNETLQEIKEILELNYY